MVTDTPLNPSVTGIRHLYESLMPLSASVKAYLTIPGPLKEQCYTLPLNQEYNHKDSPEKSYCKISKVYSDPTSGLLNKPYQFEPVKLDFGLQRIIVLLCWP